MFFELEEFLILKNAKSRFSIREPPVQAACASFDCRLPRLGFQLALGWLSTRNRMRNMPRFQAGPTISGHRVAATFLRIMTHARAAVPYRTVPYRPMTTAAFLQRQLLKFNAHFVGSQYSMAPRWPSESFFWIFRFPRRSFRDSSIRSFPANCICIAVSYSCYTHADECRILIRRTSLPYSAVALNF